MIDTRIAAYLIWGLGCFLAYTVVLLRRQRAWMRHHDARARRDLIEGVALWLVASAATAAIFAVLFGEAGSGIRGFFVAVALGAFASAGVIMATETREDDRPPARVRK